MQSGYRTLSRAAAFAALIFFATISRGSAQIRCFTTPSSAGELNCGTADGESEAASIEECCLSPNGQFFEPQAGTDGCTACIVFGWFDGTDITLNEKAGTYDLTAGFIKGGVVQNFVTDKDLASFDIAVEERGAVQGVNADFLVQGTSHSLLGVNPDPFNVSVTVRLDGIALEQAEGFTLSLNGINPTATDILAGGIPGLFVIPEISVMIRDLENVSFQFTEVDYTSGEPGRFIQPQLQLSTTIATDLVIEVIPLNLTFAKNRMLLPESLDPEQTDSNFDPNTQTATSVADFSIMPVQVTFASERSPETKQFHMGIIDDTIHEAEQVFVLTLEVVSTIDRNRVVPQRADGLTALGRIIDDDSIPIGFEQERYTVFEAFNATGDLIPIPIIKGTNLQSELEFDVISQFRDVTATRLTGVTGGDYLVNARVINPFGPNEQFVLVQFELLQDRLPEPNEEFSIELTSSGASRIVIGQEGGPFSRTTVVIVDDDVLTIGWDRNLTTVNETQGSAQLCLRILDIDRLDDLTGFNVMLFIGTIRGTATDPGDYIERRADSTFVIISDEDHRVCVDVVINNDALLEEVEFFSVQIVPPDGLSPNIRLDPDMTFVEILDDNLLTIGWERNLTTVNETQGSVQLCLDVDPFDDLTGFNVMLFIGTIRGTAADPGDYIERQADSTFVLISDVNRRACIDVEINDDALLEEREFFSVQIVPPDGLSPNIQLNPDITFVEILDDNSTVVRIGFNQTSYTVTEGVDSVATVYVAVLEGGLQRMVSVSFSTEVLISDTATAGDDFDSLTRVLVFDENTLVVPVEIPITDDAIVESLGTFTVSLVRDPDDPIDEVIIDPDAATVSILDNEIVILVEFDPTSYTVNEGDGFVEFEVVRRTPAAESVTVLFSTVGGSATGGVDYAERFLSEVTIPPSDGEGRVRVRVAITDDNINEEDEQFSGELTLPAGSLGVTLGASTAVATIIDNDPLTLDFNSTNYIINEDEGPVTVCLEKSRETAQDLSVTINYSETSPAEAQADVDFISGSVTLNFPASENVICTDIDITDDLLALEGGVRFMVDFTVTDPDVIAGPSSIVTIIDNDVPTIRFEEGDYAVREDEGPAMVCVVKDLDVVGSFDVTVTSRERVPQDAEGSADPDTGDFQVVTRTVTFAGNQARACTDIPITDDDKDEAVELFEVDLDTPDNINEGNPNVAIVRIINDDVTTIEFDSPNYTVIEDNGSVTVCLTTNRSIASALDVEVTASFKPSSSNPATDGDFEPDTRTITFPVSITASTVCTSFVITDDTIALEGNKQFRVDFTAPTETQRGVIDTACVTIIDNDDVFINFIGDIPPGALGPTYVVPEDNDSVTVCLSISTGIATDIVINVSPEEKAVPNAATADQDYVVATRQIIFPASPGVTTRCANFGIVDDDIALEETETFRVVYSIVSPPGAMRGPISEAWVNIADNDRHDVGVEFEVANYTVPENNGTVTVCVITSTGTAVSFTVGVQAVPKTTSNAATPDADFVPASRNITFPPSPTGSRVCTSFGIINDAIAFENPEQFNVELILPSNVSLGGNSEAWVTIIDDDEGVVIGIEQTVYTATEGSDASIELCAVLTMETLKTDAIVVVMFFTSDGSAMSRAPSDYDAATTVFTFDSSNNRQCETVIINDDDAGVTLTPDNVQSCETEHTVITLNVDEKSLYWPEAQIGQTVFANCTCNNVTIAQASRFCGGDIITGATWENPDVSACNFTETVGEICQLNQLVDTGEILVALEELTEEVENIGVAGVGIATFILENLSSNITQDQNGTMIESFLTVVDNLLAVDPLELQESQQLFNTSARLLEAIQTVTDALPIPENESHAVIALSSFVVAVQEIQADSVQQQSFSALLGRTLDGANNSKGLFFGMHPNATASVTLPATIIPLSANVKPNTTIRITNSVYANDLLFLRREEESQEVGSIIISASISSNDSFENLDPPVLLTFIKNPNVENATNTTCNFWDSAADSGFGDWSTRGCVVVSESEEDVICECDHLTNFAILLDVSPRETDTSIPTGIKKTLEALSYLGAIISICCLILTIATYLSSKKLRSTEPSQILISICIGLLGIYMVYILAFHATAVSGLCVLAGVLVHYFLLATFFSMAADAILIFNKIIFVFVKIRRYVPIATIISWSVPAIIAVITVAPDHDNYIDLNFCRPYGIQFYVGLLAPFLVIYILNWILFTIILVFLINRYICESNKSMKTEHQGSQVRQQFRNAIALSLLFGLGWALGLPATEGIDSISVRTAIQVLFIIVTAFQGLYIFIMQCLTGGNAVEAKKEWKRWFYFITCRPGYIPTYTLSRPSVSGSERMAGKQQLREMSTLTSLKALSSVTEEDLDKVQYETQLEMDTKLEEKKGDYNPASVSPKSEEDKDPTSVSPKSEEDEDPTSVSPKSEEDEDPTSVSPKSEEDKDPTSASPKSEEDEDPTSVSPKSEEDEDPTSVSPKSEEEDPTSVSPKSEEDEDPASVSPKSEEDKDPTSVSPKSEEDKDPTSVSPKSEEDEDPTSMNPIKEHHTSFSEIKASEQ